MLHFMFDNSPSFLFSIFISSFRQFDDFLFLFFCFNYLRECLFLCSEAAAATTACFFPSFIFLFFSRVILLDLWRMTVNINDIIFRLFYFSSFYSRRFVVLLLHAIMARLRGKWKQFCTLFMTRMLKKAKQKYLFMLKHSHTLIQWLIIFHDCLSWLFFFSRNGEFFSHTKDLSYFCLHFVGDILKISSWWKWIINKNIFNQIFLFFLWIFLYFLWINDKVK